MRPETRSKILRNIETVCRFSPNLRLCQMVANIGTLARSDEAHDLAAVSDEEFRDAAEEVTRARLEKVGFEPTDTRELADPTDTWTLPPLLHQITRGLEELGEQYPETPFVPLVLQVAEWTKEFAPFDFWDVEDADFLRAVQAHLTPSAAAS
jgi:hypothetical protein